MEQQALTGLTAAVERIADDRGVQSTGVGGMDPELVGPAGQRRELDSCAERFRADGSPQGDADRAVDRVEDLAGPPGGPRGFVLAGCRQSKYYAETLSSNLVTIFFQEAEYSYD